MESHSANSHRYTKKIISPIVGLVIIAIGIFLFAGHLIVEVNGKLVLSNARSYENRRGNVTDKDLENLKYLTKLEHLSLFGPEITDISFISGMKDLKIFSVDSKNIVDPDQFKNCRNLEVLYWGSTKLTNLDIFAENTELRLLDIEIGNPVQDISALQNMGKLETLLLTDLELTDISPISSLSSLTSLWMTSFSSISDISPLIECKSLKHLSLGNCKQVTDISQLAELKELEEIHIYGTAISDFTPLLSMESLKKVVASDGQIDPSTLAKLEAKDITVELL